MVETVEGKSHIIIKRDGREEPYTRSKLYNVALWAADESPVFANELLDSMDIKLHNRMPISKLYDEAIGTAANKISDMYPKWESIAKNLYLLKIHKAVGTKRANYPTYSEVVALNVKHKLYSSKLFDGLDLVALEAAISPELDKLFTFGGLNVFVQKYCNSTKSQLLELPQHVYMRTAIQAMKQDGTEAIIAKYLQLATHEDTDGTPKVANAAKINAQMFSCCLARPEDSQESINGTADMLSKESKFGGGLATDVSSIRGPGSAIEGNQGSSSGVKQFIKGYQELIGGYNQGSKRPMSLCVHYNWFHYQSPEITMMKEESGKDEDRARKLKYAVKWTNKLTRAVQADEDVYLFDPHKCQDMTYAWGSNLEELMDKYSRNTHIRKRKYSARSLAATVAKVKGETGNNYTFFTDNANIQNIGCGTRTQSNLCMEYFPNFTAIEHIEDKLVTEEAKQTMIREYGGDIALCNLSSKNLAIWVTLTPEQKAASMALTVRSADNSIDTSFYSNPLGRVHSEQHRNIGIGTSNYANMLATAKCLPGSTEARKLTHEIFEELSFYAIKASIELAKEKSKFPLFKHSKWSKGIFPHELSILGNSDSELNFPLLMDWESLRPDLIKYGIRNEYLLAVAPTATSGKCINATEGVDWPKKLSTIEEGTYSLPFVAPNLRECREYYVTRFNVPNKDTIELAAIRQKFICMGQSVSLAYSTPDSMFDIISDIMYAEELGLNSLYYTHTPVKGDLDDELCEGCT